jgi:hypothetical protein
VLDVVGKTRARVVVGLGILSVGVLGGAGILFSGPAGATDGSHCRPDTESDGAARLAGSYGHHGHDHHHKKCGGEGSPTTTCPGRSTTFTVPYTTSSTVADTTSSTVGETTSSTVEGTTSSTVEASTSSTIGDSTTSTVEVSGSTVTSAPGRTSTTEGANVIPLTTPTTGPPSGVTLPFTGAQSLAEILFALSCIAGGGLAIFGRRRSTRSA